MNTFRVEIGVEKRWCDRQGKSRISRCNSFEYFFVQQSRDEYRFPIVDSVESGIAQARKAARRKFGGGKTESLSKPIVVDCAFAHLPLLNTSDQKRACVEIACDDGDIVTQSNIERWNSNRSVSIARIQGSNELSIQGRLPDFNGCVSKSQMPIEFQKLLELNEHLASWICVHSVSRFNQMLEHRDYASDYYVEMKEELFEAILERDYSDKRYRVEVIVGLWPVEKAERQINDFFHDVFAGPPTYKTRKRRKLKAEFSRLLPKSFGSESCVI